ncbi:14511_t:CDS:2, partial [Acaulospora colombiana]
DIGYVPPKAPYDPRWLITGKLENENDPDSWISGFFDRGSFVETLAGWARTVTRTVEHVVPADPANAESQQEVMMEAGLVWYPNSAYKTAQAINDFNKGEQLPLMIFANWRGFSGGQRDMFLEILKYGSYIVDALTNYKQPVFVYIVPNGELRGGAWVVIDPSINKDMMEMYADTKSRAGVLESEGVVEIKYRRSRIIETMERLDETYRNLKKSLDDPTISETQKIEIKLHLEAREQELLPVYSQIALQFADLHDTPGRMKAKDTIRNILEWKDARRYFYWRVRRRLHEEYIFRKMREADSNLTRVQMKNLLVEWFHGDVGSNYDWEESDMEIVKWFDEILNVAKPNDIKNNESANVSESSKIPLSIKSRIEKIRNEAITRCIVDMGKKNPDAVFAGISELIKDLDDDERNNLLKKLSENII